MSEQFDFDEEVGLPGEATSADRFTPSEWVGSLAVFAGISLDTWEDKKVAHCEVIVVLDAPEGPQAFEDSLMFGKIAAPQLYKAGKQVVIAVVSQGEESKGKTAPTILRSPSDEQLTAAREWFKKGQLVKVKGDWAWAPDEAPF